MLTALEMGPTVIWAAVIAIEVGGTDVSEAGLAVGGKDSSVRWLSVRDLCKLSYDRRPASTCPAGTGLPRVASAHASSGHST